MKDVPCKGLLGTTYCVLVVLFSGSYSKTQALSDSGVEELQDYSGFQIFQVKGLEGFEDGVELSQFLEVQDTDNEIGVEILHGDKSEGTAQLLVPPKYKSQVIEKLRGRYPYEVIVNDLGWDIYKDNLLRSDDSQVMMKSINYRRYLSLKEIEKYLHNLNTKYPSRAILKSIGMTHEERHIYMLMISDGIGDRWSTRSEDRPVIFVEAGLHAREWISPMATLYLIDKIMANPNMTANIDWRIVVVGNPDGYEFSWKKYRLWRKNRVPLKDHPTCIGVDLNRNYDSHFKHTPIRACKSDYSGTHPFSENESTAIKDAVWYIRNRIKGYMSVHCYGQFLLHPPGVSGISISRSETTRLETFGNRVRDELKKTQGVTYKVGAPHKILYSAHGISQDWAYFKAGIPLVYTIELRDKGSEGFRLSPHRIKSTSEDLWIAMQMMAGEVSRNDVFAFRQSGM